MNGQVISVLVGGVAGVWHDVIEHEGLRWEFIKKEKKSFKKKRMYGNTLILKKKSK